MPITCSHCGEELLGAVNRCWKCGREMVSLPGVAEAPPLRRAPVTGPLDLRPGTELVEAEVAEPVIISAEVIGPEVSGNGREGAAATTSASQEQGESPATDSRPSDGKSTEGATKKRYGSPFAAPAQQANGRQATSPAPPAPIKPNYRPPAPVYPRHSAAVGGAIASLVLGLISLIGSFFTISVLITALLGLVLGYWGLYCERRAIAVIGLIFCCIALAIGGFNAVVELYTILNDGVGPFDTVAPMIEEDVPF